jgi:hypothetical protein
VVGLGLESEPVAGKGMVTTGGTHPSAREKGKGGGNGPRREGGPGRAAGPRGGEGKRRGKEARGLGCAWREREREEVSRANWAVREGEERPAWAGLQGKKREKEKERVGQAQLEKEREKELHLNVFEFEFEI